MDATFSFVRQGGYSILSRRSVGVTRSIDVDSEQIAFAGGGLQASNINLQGIVSLERCGMQQGFSNNYGKSL